MLGKISGVSSGIKRDFPNIVIWHCLNYCLQLVLDDSIKDIKQVNHFMIFLDEIYKIFHQSNKNQMNIFRISEQLGLQIIKIEKFYCQDWLLAVSDQQRQLACFSCIFLFFNNNKIFARMAKRFSNLYFLEDLVLMIDILKEISLLSESLQARNMNITRADKLIKRSMNALKIMKDAKGPYESRIDEMMAFDTFSDIDIIYNAKFVSHSSS